MQRGLLRHRNPLLAFLAICSMEVSPPHRSARSTLNTSVNWTCGSRKSSICIGGTLGNGATENASVPRGVRLAFIQR